MRIGELKTYFQDSQIEEIEKTGSNTASILRWMLRGLDQDKAIRKVKTDEEVSQNAIRAKFDQAKRVSELEDAGFDPAKYLS